ncbi:NADH oxidase [Alphaproteobacteria bacterium SO-S41]|nr:NADH oxidase [Alphaproteobacteria bacterium SO-S41]
MRDSFFQPCTVANLQLPTRFVMSAMQDRRPEDLLPSTELAQHYADRIAGGIGLIVTQGTTMDHPTSVSPYARLYPPAYDAWRRCAETVRERGGQIAMQLWHESAMRPGGFSPSGLAFSGATTGEALSTTQIEELIEVYAASAARAKALGFSGVELHGGHGYLLGLFASGTSNKRTDEWGGDTVEARMRFPLAVTRAVRKAVGPDFPILYRISQPSPVTAPKIFRNPGELATNAGALVAAGVDMLDVLAPRFWEPEFEGEDLGLNAWLKRCTGAPVISGGSIGLSHDLMSVLTGGKAFSTAHEGFAELERRFDRGDFDLIALGRPILVDPEFLVKIRAGRFDALKQTYEKDDISSEARTARLAKARQAAPASG